MDEKVLELKLKEAGIHEDHIWEVCEALTPMLSLVIKYDKTYLKKILTVIIELLKEGQ